MKCFQCTALQFLDVFDCPGHSSHISYSKLLHWSHEPKFFPLLLRMKICKSKLTQTVKDILVCAVFLTANQIPAACVLNPPLALPEPWYLTHLGHAQSISKGTSLICDLVAQHFMLCVGASLSNHVITDQLCLYRSKGGSAPQMNRVLLPQGRLLPTEAHSCAKLY